MITIEYIDDNMVGHRLTIERADVSLYKGGVLFSLDKTEEIQHYWITSAGILHSIRLGARYNVLGRVVQV